jgi:hypothetical protein
MKATFLLLAFALAGVGFARTATHSVNLSHDVIVDGTPMKAGTYRVSFENGRAVFRQSRTTVAESANVVDSPTRFGETRIITDTAGVDTTGQQPRLREIDFGGTKMRVEFN